MSTIPTSVKGVSRRTFVSAASAALAAPAVWAQNMPGRGKTVRPLRAAWDTFWFGSMVVETGLKNLGYDVLPAKSMTTPQLYQALTQGDGDFTVDIVLPNARNDLEKYKEGILLLDNPIMEPGSVQGYLIDKASSEKHNIKYLSDLRDPAKAKVFSDGRSEQAQMIGANVGWNMEVDAKGYIEKLNLGKTVKYVQGEYNILAADVVARYKAGQPVLIHAWFPNVATILLQPGRELVWLGFKPEEVGPRGRPTRNSFGCAAPTADGTCHTGDGPTQYFIGVNRKWAAENKPGMAFMSSVNMKINDRVEQNLKMMNGEKSESHLRGHAADWIKRNQAAFDGWVEAARKA